MAQLNEPIEVHLVPDIEKGEVLIDTRGSGNFTKIVISGVGYQFC